MSHCHSIAPSLQKQSLNTSNFVCISAGIMPLEETCNDRMEFVGGSEREVPGIMSQDLFSESVKPAGQ